MGLKTNPIGNRLGIIRGWESNWYGGKDYGDKLDEDEKIRSNEILQQSFEYELAGLTSYNNAKNSNP